MGEPMTLHDETTSEVPAYTDDDGNDGAPPPSNAKRWFFRISTLILAGAIVASASVVIAFSVLAKDLPTIRALKAYSPKQATVVHGAGGDVVARFATERRTVVPYERIPKVMIESVLAAEDAEFFQHAGLDYIGIARCAVKSLIAGRTVCGGSTISQQMVKTFLLSPEKKLTRKLREAILTKRVEESLTKEEILHLYLNQIYFGHSAYGIQEAAKVFFGKNVENLRLEEAALLAGLPQQPSRLDPYRHPERAERRRAYVLGQLRRLDKITEEQYQAALKTPIRVDWRRAEQNLDSNNHYAAHVRSMLDDEAVDGGWKVYTGIDPRMQRLAEGAVRKGLREVDKRQGWRGPLMHLESDQLGAVRKRLATRLATVAPTIEELAADSKAPVVWDLTKLATGDEASWLNLEKLAEKARFRRLEAEEIYAGLVTEVADRSKYAMVDLGGAKVKLTLRTGLSWARKFDTFRYTRRPKRPSSVLTVGDVVLVRPTVIKRKGDKLTVRGILEQVPKVEAALVAMDPISREVRALVGGYGIGAGTFNRATQARRQAGSTFKPILYASAFETGRYTTISTCLDAPRVYRDPWTKRSWKPKNYGGKFHGTITLREALTRSKNLCSVELIDKLGRDPGEDADERHGVDMVIDTARRLGVDSPLPRSLTLGLGSGDVTVLEMVNAYATLAAGGRRGAPVFIRKIVDAGGKVLKENRPDLEQTLRPEVAYQITSLMQSVVEDGTAQRVKKLQRPVAGKTGTTNEARNAWFIGFTPDLVVGVWVGFDNNDPLGPSETGGRAAIPIWLGFMQEAFVDEPVRDFAAPGGIVFAFVDPKTGRLAPPDGDGVTYEPFVAGTEPTELPSEAKVPDSFGLDDFDY